MQEARQRLLENAGPDALYHLDPYRAYERLQNQYKQDWKVYSSFASVAISFISSGMLLALVLPFLVPLCTFEKALLFFPILGIYGALSAIVTQVVWGFVSDLQLPIVSMLSLTLFASMSSALVDCRHLLSKKRQSICFEDFRQAACRIID